MLAGGFVAKLFTFYHLKPPLDMTTSQLTEDIFGKAVDHQVENDVFPGFSKRMGSLNYLLLQ